MVFFLVLVIIYVNWYWTWICTLLCCHSSDSSPCWKQYEVHGAPLWHPDCCSPTSRLRAWAVGQTFRCYFQHVKSKKKKKKSLDPQKETLLTCWDVSSWKWLTGRCGSKGRMELRNNGGHEGTSPASLDCNSRFTKACFCGDFISELWSLIAISLE